MKLTLTKKYAIKLYLIIFFIVQIIGLQFLKNSPEFVESFYSKGLFIWISKLMRYTLGWIPFSVGDVFYTIFILYSIRWFFINFKRIYKDTKKWLLDVLSSVSVLFFAFHFFWGFNYYRIPLQESLNLKKEYSNEALITFTKSMIVKSNKLHEKLSKNQDTISIKLPYSVKEVYDKAILGYDNLAKIHPEFSYSPQCVKSSLFSLPLTYMGFSGYVNPFTNEAQVDDLIPKTKLPTTTCHEIAHQVGYAGENEANFIGFLATINNDDDYFKYCGYTFALRYALSDLFKRVPKVVYCDIIVDMKPGIIKQFQEYNEFWKKYENPLEPLLKSSYDSYLKANNQNAGIVSYSQVVSLMVNYSFEIKKFK